MPPLRGFLIFANIHFYRDTVPTGLKNRNLPYIFGTISFFHDEEHIFFKIDTDTLRNFASACDLPNRLNFIAPDAYEFIVKVTRHPLVQWNDGELLADLKPV